MLHRLILLITLVPATSVGMTFTVADLTCPIDGERFKQTLAASGTSFGAHLDSRPYGPTPAPWPIAKCPATGFVIFSESLTPGEIAKLTPVVRSAEYQSLQKQHSNYFLAAYLMQVVGRTEGQVAYTLVQASWEATTPDQERTYRTAALAHYVKAMASASPKSKGWVSDQLMAGELERRLRRFADAEVRFRALVAGGHVSQKVDAQIVQYQLELIAKRDSEAHLAPPARK